MSNVLVPFAPQAIAISGEKLELDPAATQLQQVVRNTYQWVDPKNKLEALQHLQGLRLAYEFALSTQIALYQNKIKEIVTRDFVKRAAASLPNPNRYSGFIYNHTSEFPSTPQFIGYLTLPGEYLSSSWTFHQIDRFNQLIPSVALHILAAFRDVGLSLDDLWVAEKQRSVDPILFASFGRTFVALADWV